MKIAFFHNLPSGGGKRAVFEQIKFLSKNNTIDVYTLFSEEKDFLNFESLSCQLYNYHFSLQNSFPRSFSRVVRDFKNFVVLKKLHKKIASDIDKRKYDIVIVHPDKYTQAPFLLRFLKTKNVYYCEEVLRIAYEGQFKFNERVSWYKMIYENVTRKMRRNIDKKNACTASIIFANSLNTQKNIKNAYNAKSIVAYPGVDEKIFKPFNAQKKYDILFIGEKNSIEGYDLLSEALTLFKKPPLVKFLSFRESSSWVSDRKMSRFYNQSKVVVALARNEPFGFIPIEAAACGIPVVGVDDGGYKETIVNKKTGFLVRRNSTELYKAFQVILVNPSLQKKLGDEGRRHVLKMWTWKKNCEKLFDIIRREIL